MIDDVLARETAKELFSKEEITRSRGVVFLPRSSSALPAIPLACRAYEGDVVMHRKFDADGDMALYGVGAVLEGDSPIKVESSHCGFQPVANWIDDAQTDFEWEVIGNIYENPELLET